MLAHVKQQHGFIFIGAGDRGQLLPVKDDEFDFENSWIVKYNAITCLIIIITL